MKFTFLATTAIATAALTGVASAAPITFYYTGTISSVSNLSATFSTGQAVSGSFTFDGSVPVYVSSVAFSLYQSPTSGTLNLAGVTGGVQSPNTFIGVRNSAPGSVRTISAWAA